MDDRFNTIAGWVLFAGIVGLGLNILSGKYFHAGAPERPETLGYVIEGVEEGTEEAEMTMAAALNMDGMAPSAGEAVYPKCMACHTIDQGGADGIGPNLYGIMGQPIAAKSGYAYSSALSDLSGEVWDWENMNEWLANPKAFAPGTKMSFAGLSKIEDRAAVALYMNAQGSNLPVPEYVAEAAEAETAEGEGEEVLSDAEAGEAAAAEAEQDAAAEINEGGA